MNWKELYDLGYNVVPVWRETKTPVVKWQQWISKRQKEGEAKDAFRNDHDGIAIICYDGLTCIDFDVKSGSVIDAFFDGLEKHAWLKGDKFPPHWMQTTPSGGLHIVIHCPDRPFKSRPLARTAEKGILIETRGQGGLFLVHPTEGYNAEEPIGIIDKCTATEYDMLMEYCLAFDAIENAAPPAKILKTAPKSYKPVETGESTFDKFNREYDGLNLLVDYGWEYLHQQGNYVRLSRPGTKSHDVHAVYDTKRNFFYNHSTMDAVFNVGGFTPVQLVCKLMHNDDMSQTGRWIREFYKAPAPLVTEDDPLSKPPVKEGIKRRNDTVDPWPDDQAKKSDVQTKDEFLDDMASTYGDAIVEGRNVDEALQETARRVIAKNINKAIPLETVKILDMPMKFQRVKFEEPDDDSDRPYLFSLAQKPEFIATCLDVAHSGSVWGIGAPGNIVTIGGPPKARKTSLIMGIGASALSDGKIFLNMSCDIQNKGMIVADTEQPSNFFWLTMSGIHHMAGLNTDTDRFKGIMLRPHSPSRRLYWIERYLAESENGLLVLDGSADLCEDTNDSKESSKVSQRIMQWTYDYNVLLINAIHVNKGDKLPRGHIGAELSRKSDTIINVDMDEHSLITTVSCKYSRFGFFKSFYFMHNDQGVLDVVSETDFSLSRLALEGSKKTYENRYPK